MFSLGCSYYSLGSAVLELRGSGFAAEKVLDRFVNGVWPFSGQGKEVDIPFLEPFWATGDILG